MIGNRSPIRSHRPWPVFRNLIQRHASQATSGPSGEDYLKLFDKVVSSPIPLDRLASVLQPLYESWGIRTGKERNEWMPTRIGRTIAQHPLLAANIDRHYWRRTACERLCPDCRIAFFVLFA